MIPTIPPDFARRDAARAASLFAGLNPRDPGYALATAANTAAQAALALSTRLWENAGNHDEGEAETYRRRKASKEAAHEAARQRWKVESFARGNRYARKKIKHAADVAARASAPAPLVAGPLAGEAPRTFREWRALAREEEQAKADAAARAYKQAAIEGGALTLP